MSNLPSSLFNNELASRFSFIELIDDPRHTVELSVPKRPIIISLIDAYAETTNPAEIKACDLKILDRIKSNPKDLMIVYAGMSVYGHAACMSLDCLKAVHSAYLAVQSLEQLNLEPCEVLGEENRTALFNAVEFGLVDEVKYLVNKVGCNTNAVDKSNNTAMHLACEQGDKNILIILLASKNVNVNVINMYMKTPLYYCVRREDVEMCDMLLKRDAFITYKRRAYKVDLYNNFVLPSKNNDMIVLFSRYIRRINQRNKGKEKFEGAKITVRNRIEEYKFLCNALQDESNVHLVKFFAQKMRFKSSSLEKTKKELCKEILEKLNVYISNPALLYTI